MSVSAQGKFLYPTGREGAKLLGYDPDVLREASPGLLESFCGVGNPFSLDVISPGSSVLDFGCGAGFDLYVANRFAGAQGRICGLDLTPQMADRAKANLAEAGFTQIEIRTLDSECIPYPDNMFDVVISNGVINLVPQKPRCFKEIFRVLKPGGRLQFADVVLEQELPQSLSASPDAWSQWIGGAVPVRDQILLMEQAGFIHAECTGKTNFRTSAFTVGALFRATKPETA